MVNYTKKYHLGNAQNSPLILRRSFILLGNYYNRAESWINRRFLKIETPDALFIKPLSDEVALEKGVEFFYEIMVYLILLVLPLYEMYTTHSATAVKTDQQEKRLKSIEESIDFIRKEQETQADSLRQSLEELKSMLKNESNLNKIAAQQELTKKDLHKFLDFLAVKQNLVDPIIILPTVHPEVSSQLSPEI